MPQQGSVLFYEIKLEISEVFGFSILVLMLKSKTRKTRNFFLRLLNLSEFPLFEGIGSFRGFRVFDFGSYAEM